MTRIALLDPQVDVALVNDLADVKTLAHLLKYDSIHGNYKGTIEVQDDALNIDGHQIKVLAEKSPLNLPWEALKIDLVIESTGK